jgi:pimeloyl-ACP methyl ester carboxylesterase
MSNELTAKRVQFIKETLPNISNPNYPAVGRQVQQLEEAAGAINQRLFIAKASTPGAAESMQKTACTRMVDFHLVDGAGHWVQQEQPEKVTQLLRKFLQDQSLREGHKQ